MNHNLKIRKIIKEEVAKLLDEDFESVSELRQVTNDVLLELARENIDFFVERIKKGNPLDFFYSITLHEAFQNSKHQYKKINEFLRLSQNIRVSLCNPKNEKTKGEYKHATGYNVGLQKEIILYLRSGLIEELKTKISESISKGHEITYYDLYYSFYYEFTSTLIHELQHSYDDYRSRGNAFTSKEYKKYNELLNKIKIKQTSEELIDKEEFSRYAKYLNLPHEIWARFSQAVFKIRFAKGEVLKNEKGQHYLKQNIYPILDVVNSLKREFSGWEKLSDKMRKKLLNKIVQFWHLEKEKIEKNNANPQYFS